MPPRQILSHLGVIFALVLCNGTSAHAQIRSPHFAGIQHLMLQIIGRAVPYIRPPSKDGDNVDLARMPSDDGSANSALPPSPGFESAPPRPLVSGDDLIFGVEIDAGVPHLMGGNIVFEPWNFLQLRFGGGYNLVSGGLRGGLTVNIPLVDALRSLTISGEGGHFFDGDPSFILSFFDGSSPLSAAAIRSVTYDYAAGLLGVELGNERFRFTLQAGVMYLNATGSDGTGSTVASAWLVAPAGRLAFSVFLL